MLRLCTEFITIGNRYNRRQLYDETRVSMRRSKRDLVKWYNSFCSVSLRLDFFYLCNSIYNTIVSFNVGKIFTEEEENIQRGSRKKALYLFLLRFVKVFSVTVLPSCFDSGATPATRSQTRERIRIYR